MMSKTQKEKLIRELKYIHNDLCSYQRLASYSPAVKNRSSTKEEMNALRSKLQRELAMYKFYIDQYGGEATMKVSGIDMDVFELALAYDTNQSYTGSALNAAILKVNTAIGKMQAPEDSIKMEIQLFDKMQLHPKVVEVARRLYANGHYAQAIEEAYKAVIEFVKEKASSYLEDTVDGTKLMGDVFQVGNPMIKLNKLLSHTDRSEQEGFTLLFKGAAMGIRNRKAHGNVIMTDPYKTLEYLGFASLLMKKADEGELVPTWEKQSKSKET